MIPKNRINNFLESQDLSCAKADIALTITIREGETLGETRARLGDVLEEAFHGLADHQIDYEIRLFGTTSEKKEDKLMSMITLPYGGTALVLAGEEMKDFEFHYGKEYGMEEEEVRDLIMYREALSPSDPKTDPFTVLDLPADDVYGGIRFYTFDIPGKETEHRYSECYAIFTDKQPTKGSLFHPLYASEEELVREFKGKLGRYLPDDFDYMGHTGIFAYCATC